MKMLGTLLCPVISARAAWIAAPSSIEAIVSMCLDYRCEFHGYRIQVVRTNFIQFQQIEFSARFGKKLLGLLAVRTVRLAEDSNRVCVDDLLCLFFGSHDFFGWWGRTVPEDQAFEEVDAWELNDGRFGGVIWL